MNAPLMVTLVVFGLLVLFKGFRAPRNTVQMFAWVFWWGCALWTLAVTWLVWGLS